MPEELDLADIPECVAELWATFLALHAARPAGAFAPSPIGYGIIGDYCAMMHVTLSPWEVETLVEIDRAALRTLAEK